MQLIPVEAGPGRSALYRRLLRDRKLMSKAKPDCGMSAPAVHHLGAMS
jgi:hypothetical protein